MKGFLLAIGLVVVVVLVVIFSADPVPPESPVRPSVAGPEDPPEPSSPPALPDEPGSTGEPESAAGQVVIHTNVPGAEVTLTVRTRGAGAEPEPQVLTADAEGIANFPVPETDEQIAKMSARARAEGYRPATEDVRRRTARLTLTPGIPIRGTVVDDAGQPIEGAGVSIGSGSWDGSDAAGAFEVFADEAGPAELAIRHSAYLDRTISIVAPGEQGEVVLSRGLTISGRVSFPDGKPVPGVTLQTGEPRAYAGTDADGRYVLSGLERGVVTVQCYAAPGKKKVEVGDNAVDFVVKEHVARFRFLDENGRPFRFTGFYIQGTRNGEFARSAVGHSGENGEYLTSGLSSGTELKISPGAAGYARTVTTVEFDGEPRLHEIEIVMSRTAPQGTVLLRVVDPAGAPLSSAALAFVNEAGAPIEGFYGRRIELDEDGRCRLQVPAGRYELEVNDTPGLMDFEGYALTSKQPVEVPVSESVAVDVVVPFGGRIRITVKDADGEVQPVGAARLFDLEGVKQRVRFLRPTDGGWTSSLDEPGTIAHLRPIPPGRYRLVVGAEDAVVAEQEADVEAGRTIEVEIQLPRR